MGKGRFSEKKLPHTFESARDFLQNEYGAILKKDGDQFLVRDSDLAWEESDWYKTDTVEEAVQFIIGHNECYRSISLSRGY